MSTNSQQDSNNPTTDNVFLVKQNGDIWKSGQPSICPFAPPLPIQSKIQGGGIDMLRMSCSLKCPNCMIMQGAVNEEDQKANVNRPFLQITCGGYPVMQYCEVENQDKSNAEKPGIIQMGRR